MIFKNWYENTNFYVTGSPSYTCVNYHKVACTRRHEHVERKRSEVDRTQTLCLREEVELYLI